jgi:hypothetical protein
LAELASTVDALRCASEIQAGMADRNAGAWLDGAMIEQYAAGPSG